MDDFVFVAIIKAYNLNILLIYIKYLLNFLPFATLLL